jgi:LuxR family maltose regulon positive regulatory protein
MVRLHILLTRDLKEALYWLDEARSLPPEFPILHHVTNPCHSAFLQLWTGDIPGAERLARQTLANIEELRMPPGIPTLEALLVLTDVLIETARLTEAEAALARAESLAGQLAPPAYFVHVAIRRIELTAAVNGPAAGADAAARARASLKDRRLGATITDALTQEHAYWLLAEGRAIEATQLTATLRPGPPCSILEAKLDSIHHGGRSVARLLGGSDSWSAPERLEADLIRDALDGYPSLPQIVEGAVGFSWTVVRQGQPLLRHLMSPSPHPSGPGATTVLDRVASFNAAFRPVDTMGPGGRLSERELTLLRLLPSHLSYAEIAAELFISVNTVKANLKALYRKLGATSRSEAVDRARARLLI